MVASFDGFAAPFIRAFGYVWRAPYPLHSMHLFAPTLRTLYDTLVSDPAIGFHNGAVSMQ
jgi:hypothetical protein